jgi:hypothetical protein
MDSYLNIADAQSQLQTEIALSSTEAEYIGVSKALHEVIPIIIILQEMKKLKYDIGTTNPKVNCKIFEDTSSALEMAKVHKFHPRTNISTSSTTIFVHMSMMI